MHLGVRRQVTDPECKIEKVQSEEIRCSMFSTKGLQCSYYFAKTGLQQGN